LLEHIQAWATVAATAIAFFGLLGVYLTLREGSREQRIQWQPYIRIDLTPLGGTTVDFKPPDPYFHKTDEARDLAPDSTEEKVGFTAWVRNYQSNPLGVALAVQAFIVVAAAAADVTVTELEYFDLRVPYAEYGKPVAVDLFYFPATWRATATVSLVSYYDLYDRRHQHRLGSRGTNALHGRLTCHYEEAAFESQPESWPRGPQVEFD
jgi:hypothetical protein